MRYAQLMPICCNFRDCEALRLLETILCLCWHCCALWLLLVTSLAHIS